MTHTAHKHAAPEPVDRQLEEATVEPAAPQTIDLAASEAAEASRQSHHYDERGQRVVACMGTEALVNATLKGHMSMAEAMKAKRESGH